MSSRLSIGIVGLPNVGKSTLFRALTAVSVPAENYPFCTIDPNVGVVAVPDRRLDRLAEEVEPEVVKPAVVQFVDIAGLVAGASRGECLGNKFLQNIREVDAIAHVVRCFEDDSVARAGGGGRPDEDLEIVRTELALADLETVERRLEKVEKKTRLGDGGEVETERDLLRRIRDRLATGEPARRESMTREEAKILAGFDLLTGKPVMYVPNVDVRTLEGERNEDLEAVRRWVEVHDPASEVVPICARLEAELAQLDREERLEFLQAHGQERSGLDRLIRAGFRLLGLQTFFTWNDEELRAWTVRQGAHAPEAAGRIHSDFEKHFIRAETIHVDDFLDIGSMKAARDQGRVRSEGKDYEVRDGDILIIRSSA